MSRIACEGGGGRVEIGRERQLRELAWKSEARDGWDELRWPGTSGSPRMAAVAERDAVDRVSTGHGCLFPIAATHPVRGQFVLPIRP
jgi:hypothetical protein